MKSTICVAEDRVVCEPSLKLLLLSLAEHCPRTPVQLFYPPAGADFVQWIEQCPQVRLHDDRLEKGFGWDIKPQAILRLMDQGFEEVVWIDSDVIVAKDIVPLFAQLGSETFVATEDALGKERNDGRAVRAQLWGFPVGRVLPFGLNSGVLRATRAHYNLLRRWWDLLQSSAYRDSQNKEWGQRPVHMLGDQDVLTALLTSKEFSSIPIYILRRGKHILQFNGIFGYTTSERLRSLAGNRSTFIHSFAGKPWSEKWPTGLSNGLSEYVKRVYLDLSPYTLTAMKYRVELAGNTKWMDPHYAPSRILRFLGLGHPTLVGLPMAVFADMARVIKKMRKSNSVNNLVALSDLEADRPEIAGKL